MRPARGAIQKPMDAVALALAIDALTGEPPALYRRIGHPVTWFGRLIDALDRALNRGPARRAKGGFALALVLAAFVAPAAILVAALKTLPFPVALAIEALLGSALLAHSSLHAHVGAVARAPSLAEAKAALAMIVGRDVAPLDEAGVSRAALESLSENLSDGVVAPAFWFALLGLPGLVAYKVVNTADSMIGHKTPRHRRFGCPAARLDDLLNLIPARLTAALVILAAPKTLLRVRTIFRDAPGHASPNAGWPEAAFAVALNITLGGPRRYGAQKVAGHTLNAAGSEATSADIARGLRLSLRVGLIQFALYAALALAI
ncbi:MAG: adenosylcobinamide-phosphate synthase CbiB [Pseudomonadota bacterium]